MRYIGEHTTHVAVIVFLALYPVIYNLLLQSPLGSEARLLLPGTSVMITIFYFGLFAMSFDFISGYTGYLSFGHAAFYGIGAYFVVLIANSKFHYLNITVAGFEFGLLSSNTPLILNILLVGLLASLTAFVVGIFAFRLTNVYFAIITLAFSHVMYVFMSSWKFVGNNPQQGTTVLGRDEAFEIGVPFLEKIALSLGPVNIDIPLSVDIGQLKGDTMSNFFGLGLAEPINMSYYMVGLVVVVSYLAMQRIIHSPFGRVMIAIRENEERTEAVGYNTMRYKLGAFAMSAFFAAVAGALLAGYTGSVNPDNTFYFLVTGEALLAAIIGGLGTLIGPLFGRAVHEGIRDILATGTGGLRGYLETRLSEDILSTTIYGDFSIGEFFEVFLSGHENFFIGLLFVVFVIYVPGGIMGSFRNRVGGKFSKQVNLFRSLKGVESEESQETEDQKYREESIGTEEKKTEDETDETREDETDETGGEDPGVERDDSGTDDEGGDSETETSESQDREESSEITDEETDLEEDSEVSDEDSEDSVDGDREDER